jgi:hypothetical protein
MWRCRQLMTMMTRMRTNQSSDTPLSRNYHLGAAPLVLFRLSVALSAAALMP